MMKYRIALFLLFICLGRSKAFAQGQNFPGTPIPFAGVPSGSCGSNQTAVNTTNGNLYTCNAGSWAIISGGGSLPTATVKGQIPSSTAAGTTYAAQNKPLADEQDYSGTTGCDIINNLAAASPYQKVTAEALTGSIYNCANVDLNNPFNTIQLNGGNIFTTDVGWTWGNRQVVNGNVGNIGATAAVSGTQFRASANFPLGSTPGTLLATGSIGAGTVSLTKTGTAIQLAPYDILVFSGDPTIYYVKKCTAGTDPPCADTTAGGAGASDWYKLTGTITVNITPVLASSPSGAATTLTSALVELGDIQGGSPSGEKLESAFLSCALNSGNGIGIRDNYAQENSDGRNAWVNNCGRGFWVPSAANSGDWSNLNVGYTADANCTTPTIPFETSGAHKKFSRVTITTQSCTAAKITKGIFHITNAQIGGVSAPGGLVLEQAHGEAKGPSNSVDMILVDSANPSPAGNTGAVEIPGASGCPTGNPCLNLLHVASNFAGTLHLHDSTCNNGTTNAVVDDINANTMTCANNSVALGEYRMDATGHVFTNFNSTDMTKGVNLYNGTLGFYTGGVLNASITEAGALKVTSCTGCTSSVVNSGTITVPSGNSVLVICTSTCSVPVPVPVLGYQICVKNIAGGSTVITLSALGSSASYPKADDSGYGTAGTGTMVSSAAAGNKVCLIGKDATHYELGAVNAAANWTVN